MACKCDCRKRKAEIAVEIYRLFEKYGAMSDVLCVIGSYGDTLEDDDILSSLRVLNEHYSTHPVPRFDCGASVAPSAGLEPATSEVEAPRSIRLS